MSIRSDEPETGSRGPITARSMARSMAATADALTRDAPDREAAFAYLVTAVRELAKAVEVLCEEPAAPRLNEIEQRLWSGVYIAEYVRMGREDYGGRRTPAIECERAADFRAEQAVRTMRQRMGVCAGCGKAVELFGSLGMCSSCQIS